MLSVQVMDAVAHLRRVETQRSWFERMLSAPDSNAELDAALRYMSATMQNEVRRAEISVATSSAVGFLALLAAFLVGNRTVRSIRRLARGAKALAVGDYRRKICVQTGDELESLAASFNALGESLIRHEEIQKEQAEMLAGMVEAARVASASLDARECGKAIASAVCAHLGASDAAVFRKDAVDGGLRVAGRCGERHGADWKRLAAHAADSGGYLVVAEHNSGRNGAGEALLVGTPLVTGSDKLGAIVARFGECVSRDELLIGSLRADVLRAFGVHAAAAFANAEAHSRTAEYSEALEDWVEHVSAVMRVTDAISTSPNLDEALPALAKAAAATMGTDECVIFLPDREGYLVVRSSFCSEERRKVLCEARLRPGESVTGKAFAEKRCVTAYDAKTSDDDLTRKLCSKTELGGILSAPLIVGDEAIGVIALYCMQPREFGQKDIQLAMSIALHAAVVVRNATMYSVEANIAQRLQTSLVSEAPEQCSGLTFAGRYEPALNEAIVGGDFYDVTNLPNGRIAVAIADVSGKGLEAAMHLAACKYMLKALAYAHPDDPAAVLDELNNAINQCFHYDFFLTAFYAVIDPVTMSICFANAGHPPAILITEGARMHTSLSSTGIPLGAGPACDYQVQSVTAKPGDILLLYTDGVTDAVKGGARLELEGLHQMIFDAADEGLRTGEELVCRLADELTGNRNEDQSRKDDIALLAVTFGSAATASDAGG